MSSRDGQEDTQIYARVVDNIDRAVVAIDRAGRIALFNPAAQACTGLSERQSLGRHFEELFAGQDKILALIRSALDVGRSISDDENIHLQRPSAPPLPVSVSASPIYTDSGDREGVVLIIRDLSRLRELEDAVRRADRLSMLGTLAAGLAHEIKNPLGGIKGAAQLLAMELGTENPLHEYTGIMIKEVERVNGIIEELMDLARPRLPQFQEVNIGRLLGDIILFQKEAHRGKQIDFVLTLDPSIPPLLGDENLLTRLFLNLIKNAAEAIEGKGRVEICSRVASDFHMQKPGQRPVPLIVIEIRDSGRGIPAEDLDRIFTPFYTTKNRGSGLGLATCQKIVDSHRGLLRFDSREGEGTTVSVSLPFIR
ncbi:nitrogen fixation sensor histidine kinase GnfL [Desulfuromonas carbonis]|uniref:two-component system sensor histidine kinase NtrB n=1 Tax=Desulfuromonas sp. DDH964 TaxID=1823759 RepID=UPI00078C4108|nr:ATP-binding protein [Desulfuromonas sp. DDH964]AMV71670.1 nitrogen fixation master sensor histidine kinase, PAS domain-containing [Desulfuromonas sp. DDH964]